jgi:hypothetical protein
MVGFRVTQSEVTSCRKAGDDAQNMWFTWLYKRRLSPLSTERCDVIYGLEKAQMKQSGEQSRHTTAAESKSKRKAGKPLLTLP